MTKEKQKSEAVRSRKKKVIALVEAPAVTPVLCIAPAVEATTTPRAGLKLETSCILRDAPDMQFQLLAADFGSSDALIDGSAVERIDTAGLQMLVAFVHYQEKQARKVGWTAASPELLKAGKSLGVLKDLRLEETIASGEAA
jgi:phospholipid transport system transporter-binding protein